MDVDSCLNTPEILVEDATCQEAREIANSSSHLDADTAQQKAEQEAFLKPGITQPFENGATLPPFRRWVTTLRRRNLQRRKGLTPRQERGSLDDPGNGLLDVKFDPRKSTDTPKHRKSLSHSSSMALITAVKTASVTLASVSIGPLRNRTSHFRGAYRSSGTSEARRSIDSHITALSPVVDEITWLRSLQRRKVLEELISTEESYLADMKAFVNVRNLCCLLTNPADTLQVYLTLLASPAAFPSQIRKSVNQTLTQVVQLHEDLLGELYKVIPHAEYTQDDSTSTCSVVQHRKHFRWHSADVTLPRNDLSKSERKLRHSFEIGRVKEQKSTALTADTKTAAGVARVFNQLVSSGEADLDEQVFDTSV